MIALVIFRPLRLVLSSGDKFRQARIILLKATHAPIVAAIYVYELLSVKLSRGGTRFRGASSSRQNSMAKRPSKPPPDRPQSSGYHHRPRMASPSHHQPTNAPAAGGAAATVERESRERRPEDDTSDPPTDVQVQIAELTAKVDRLTALVVALQPGAGVGMVRT